MPVVAVNVVKVLFVAVLYGFLLFVVRAMRSQVAVPAPTSDTTTPVRRRVGSGDAVPPPPPRAVLRVFSTSDQDPLTVEIAGNMVMGRGASADITIDDQYASDHHAAFGFDGTTLWVEDLGSTNGTRIGESRIDERTPLTSGTEILVGRTKVVVE
jgi:hypothetical protein